MRFFVRRTNRSKAPQRVKVEAGSISQEVLEDDPLPTITSFVSCPQGSESDEKILASYSDFEVDRELEHLADRYMLSDDEDLDNISLGLVSAPGYIEVEYEYVPCQNEGRLACKHGAYDFSDDFVENTRGINAGELYHLFHHMPNTIRHSDSTSMHSSATVKVRPDKETGETFMLRPENADIMFDHDELCDNDQATTTLECLTTFEHIHDGILSRSDANANSDPSPTPQLDRTCGDPKAPESSACALLR